MINIRALSIAEDEIHYETTVEELDGSDLNQLPADLALHVAASALPEFYVSRNGSYFTIEIEASIYHGMNHNTAPSQLLASAMSSLRMNMSIYGFEDIDTYPDKRIVRWTSLIGGPMTFDLLINHIRQVTEGIKAAAISIFTPAGIEAQEPGNE
ncbi:hypothetical protein [Flaviaesturariibacter amylovorans]